MATLNVLLKPIGSSAGYVSPHSFNVKKDDDAGKTIKFSAEDSGFAVVIHEADKLFVDWEKEYWCCSIRELTYIETPKIKSNLTVDTEWKCYVYCEKTQDWAKDSADSPPIIIIVNN